MKTMANVQTIVANLSQNSGLDDRVVDWCNLVWAEIACGLAGTGVHGVTDTYITGWVDATSLLNALTGAQDTFYGSFYQSATTLTSGAEAHSYSALTGPKMPQDILQIHGMYHVSATQNLTDMIDDVAAAAPYAQQYRRRTIQDLMFLRDGLLASSSLAAGDINKEVGYAVAGMIFTTTTIGGAGTDGFCMKFDVFPHPTGDSKMLMRYTQAPDKFAVGEGDKSCVYLAKYPETFISGVMCYVWLYLNDYSNYLKSYRAFVDGVAKVARMSQPQVSRQHLRGYAPGQPRM